MVRKRPEAPPDLFDLPLEPQGASPKRGDDRYGRVEEDVDEPDARDAVVLDDVDREDDEGSHGGPTEIVESPDSGVDEEVEEDVAQDEPPEHELDEEPDGMDDTGSVAATTDLRQETSRPENLTLFEPGSEPERSLAQGSDAESASLGSGASPGDRQPGDQLAGSWIEPDLSADLAGDSLFGEDSASSDGRQAHVGIGPRLAAGVADGLIQVGALAMALLATVWRGLQPGLEQWPGLLLFLLAFSFLYWTFSLAFWGQTPGMAWTGLKARDFGDQPLTFGQTALRWLGAWLTIGLAGLPVLVALSGRSFSDRLSRSETHRLDLNDEHLDEPYENELDT